jgi:hypothetical protein
MWDLRKIGGIIALLTVAVAKPAQAEDTIGRTVIRPELHVAGISNYENRNGVSDSYGIATVTAELSIYPHARPYYGGLFLDQRYFIDGWSSGGTNLGGYFRYNLSRWDATSWLFVNQSPGNAHSWLYAARLRYRVVDNHKLGVEAVAPVDDAFSPMLMFGYYGSLADTLSVKFQLGADTHGNLKRAARVEIGWQIF